MFENNINSPFMSSNMSYGPMMRNAPVMGISPQMMGIRSAPFMSAAPRSGGFLSSLLGLRGNAQTAGALTGTRSFNFGNLLNNASKALGVVKEAIPIVKEVGPMMGNMKSMLKLAAVFKDETDTVKNTNISSKEQIQENSAKESDTINSTTINQLNNNEPNFFL